MSAQLSLEHELRTWKAFLVTHAALTRFLDADMQRAHALTLSDYEVLLQLANSDNHRLRMSTLADRVLLTRSGMTRLVRGLEEAGYVRRAACAGDARVSYAELTAAGLEKFVRARETHLEGVHRLFTSRFSASELETLAALLERLPQSPSSCRCSSGSV